MRRQVLQVSSFFIAAVVAVGLMPATARAQSYVQPVWNQLTQFYDRARADGYTGSRNYLVGRLDDDKDESWTITLEAGRDYRIVGVCDNDCKDLDLDIQLDGTSVGSDMLTDDFPIVNFTSTKGGGRYTIKVIMADCQTAPCYWGIGIFYK